MNARARRYLIGHQRRVRLSTWKRRVAILRAELELCERQLEESRREFSELARLHWAESFPRTAAALIRGGR